MLNMSKNYNFRRKSQSEFANLLLSGCRTQEPWQMWSDFITMTACAISNGFEQDKSRRNQREELYLHTIQKYSKTERQIFPQLIASLANALEREPEQDFLGEVFMGLSLFNHWKGQFFTPMDICRAMIKIEMCDLESQIREENWISLIDPACGAGALLIAFRNELIIKGFGPETALFVGQDIDWTAALMSYIQLSLLGCPGYIVIGDTLSSPLAGKSASPLLIEVTPEQDIWVMPALYMTPWPERILFEKLK